MTQLTARDVQIRPYGVSDSALLAGMSDRLSRRSLYLRFFSGTPRIPESYARALDHLDHWDHDALVGLDGGELAGIAEYVRDPGQPDQAELAVLITDGRQHQGLGSLLVGALTELALSRGIRAFNADVHLDNQDGLSILSHAWPTAIPRRLDGAAHYHLPLPRPAPRWSA